jgi:hypothetical protein
MTAGSRDGFLKLIFSVFDQRIQNFDGQIQGTCEIYCVNDYR